MAEELPVDPYPQSDANAGAKPFAGEGMARAFGGQAGIRRITARVVELNVADPRIKAIFAEHDLVRLQRTLVENLQRATRNARSACFLRRAEPGAGQAGTDGTRCDRALTAARRPGAGISRIEGGELP